MSSRSRPSRHLIVSPHLDDAVLSLGGIMSVLGQEAADLCVLTIFAGDAPPKLSPFARRFHEACRLGDDAMAVRRRENAQACRTLGARARNLDFLDCIYRVADDGSPLIQQVEAIFASEAPPEPELDARLSKCIGDELAAELPDVVYLPLGVGRHIDHHHVRRCGELAAGQDFALRFYEDQPYLGWSRDPAWQKELTAGLQRSIVEIELADLNRKLAAVGEYGSQVQMLWHGTPGWPEDVRSWACLESGGLGEALWQTARSNP